MGGGEDGDRKNRWSCERRSRGEGEVPDPGNTVNFIRMKRSGGSLGNPEFLLVDSDKVKTGGGEG